MWIWRWSFKRRDLIGLKATKSTMWVIPLYIYLNKTGDQLSINSVLFIGSICYQPTIMSVLRVPLQHTEALLMHSTVRTRMYLLTWNNASLLKNYETQKTTRYICVTTVQTVRMRQERNTLVLWGNANGSDVYILRCRLYSDIFQETLGHTYSNTKQ